MPDSVYFRVPVPNIRDPYRTPSTGLVRRVVVEHTVHDDTVLHPINPRCVDDYAAVGAVSV